MSLLSHQEAADIVNAHGMNQYPVMDVHHFMVALEAAVVAKMASADKLMAVTATLAARDAAATIELERIGRSIGYGNAQHILGQLWDRMLAENYALPPGRGRMGVTVDDELPPIPKAATRRREMRPNGGYEMVPAYSVAELKAFGHASIDYSRNKGKRDA